MKKIAFTLCSNNYLAQAITLKDSFLNYHKDYEFFIGLVDKLSKNIDYTNLNIIEVEKTEIKNFSDMVSRYNIVELNTSVKSFYFQYFFNKCDAEIVKYIDPDIMFFSSLGKEDEEIHIKNKITFFLTPHITSPIPLSDTYPHQENKFLNFGIFNFGFLSIRKSPSSEHFLNWWSERLEKLCVNDVKNGLFVDQLWGNFIPLFYPNDYRVSHHLGLNMAHWNIHERTLSLKDNKWFVNDIYPLVFYHFSNYDPLDSENRITKRIPKNFSFNERPDLKSLFDIYRTQLLKNNYVYFLKIKPYFLKAPSKSKTVKSSLIKRITKKLFK